MEQHKNDQAAQPAESGVEKMTSQEQGRQPENGEQTAAEQSNDISQIDQQEGQMNNGQLGGNFDAPDGTTKQA
jgi:hypothetical protein